MSSDCEPCGLLNHFKKEMVTQFTRRCVQMFRYTALKTHRLTRSDCTTCKGDLTSFRPNNSVVCATALQTTEMIYLVSSAK